MTGVDGVTGAKVDDAVQPQSASDSDDVEASEPESKPAAEEQQQEEAEPKARKGWMSWWRGGTK